jgi:peptidoglycan L-alanyl-D-glutamate endopeptidase CwlK
VPKLPVPTEEEVVKKNPKILTLHPLIRPRCIQHVILCYKAGVPIRITQGKRTFEEQEALWKKGRILIPGSDPKNDGNWIASEGKVVTKVRKWGWHTMDQITGSCAYDVVLLIVNADGSVKAVTWEKGDRDGDGLDDWKEVADLGLEAGMDAGYYWTKFMDVPHFERHRGLDMLAAISRYERDLDVLTGRKIPGDTMMA